MPLVVASERRDTSTSVRCALSQKERRLRTLVWFRGKDLRVSDHEPLVSAVETSRGEGDVVLLFVLDPFFFSREAAAEMPHRMQFLLESLTSLAENLAHLGGTLLVVPGKSYERAKPWG